MVDSLVRIGFLSLQVLQDAAFWMVFSFAAGGLLHEFVPQAFFQKHLGGTNVRSLSMAVLMGMLLPMCSCGVIPLALSLYWSGASLSATLAFMAATPIINPAAALLALAMFGPKLAAIYLAAGYVIPMGMGWLALRFGGRQHVAGYGPSASRKAPGAPRTLIELKPSTGPADRSNAFPHAFSHASPHSEPAPCFSRLLTLWRRGVWLGRRIGRGLVWGFVDMGASASQYILLGAVLAGCLLGLTPQSWIQNTLGNPGLLTMSAAVLLGTVMYVCSVGHIPFVAALLATGASPGVGLTFLIAGVATNAPELVSIHRLISPRAAVVYATGLIGCSVLVGLLTDWLLMPGFTPLFQFTAESGLLSVARGLNLVAPVCLAWPCMAVVIGLGLWRAGATFWPRLRTLGGAA